MQLDETKTYRTRDGSRTGIRVRPLKDPSWHKWGCDQGFAYGDNGGLYSIQESSSGDLIEEQPADRPFSYDACPVGPDGRRRAVTRDGREVVLLCDDAPREFCVIGLCGEEAWGWNAEGLWAGRDRDGIKVACDLLVPPPPKRVVWVNLYHNTMSTWYETEEHADRAQQTENGRLGNRAHPIEIDGSAS